MVSRLSTDSLSERGIQVMQAAETLRLAEDKKKELLKFANEFYEACQKDGSFPDKLLAAQALALEKRDFNEITLMAAATGGRSFLSPGPFELAIENAESKADLYEVICVALSAELGPWTGAKRGLLPHIGFPFMADVLNEIKIYVSQYGPEDFTFVPAFIRRRLLQIEEDRLRWEKIKREQQELSRIEREERERKLEQERQKRFSEQMKAREQWYEERRQKQKAQEQKEEMLRQKEQADRVVKAELQDKSLEQQLQFIVSHKDAPKAYGLEFGAVSEAELRTLPKDLLVRIIAAFLKSDDPAWKSLQQKARSVLIE